jgi:hypothetical protein
MAHFAQLDQSNKVLNVIVVNDSVILINNIEDEQKGIDFLKSIFGQDTIWKKTSYNTYGGAHSKGGIPFRKNYAVVGGIYDEQRNAFISKKPYNSWILNEDTCLWNAPVARPESQNIFWDESSLSWVGDI